MQLVCTYCSKYRSRYCSRDHLELHLVWQWTLKDIQQRTGNGITVLVVISMCDPRHIVRLGL